MTNYRISKIDYFTSSSVWTKIGNQSTSSLYTKVWGVMIPSGSVAQGSVSLEGGGDIYLNQLVPGQIYPCYPTAIRVSAGTGSILS
jgi:hypothetical protein